MPDLDELQIKIEADSNKASNAIDNLIGSLENLNNALSSLNIKPLQQMANAMAKMTGASTSAKAINSLGKIIASSFDIKSKKGIDDITRSLEALYKAASTDNLDGLLSGENSLKQAIQDNYKYKTSIDSTTQSIRDYVNATNKSGVKVGMADMVKEFGENFKSMSSVLGKSFKNNLSSTQEGVQDLAQYLNEMNSVLGTQFDTDNVEKGFAQLVDVLRNAKAEVYDFKEAVSHGLIDESDTSKAAYNAVKSIYDILENEPTNGLDAVVHTFNQLSMTRLPDMGGVTKATKEMAQSAPQVEETAKSIEGIGDSATEAIAPTEELADAVQSLESFEGFHFPDLGTGIEPVTRTKQAMEDISKRASSMGKNISSGFSEALPILLALAHEVEKLAQFFDRMGDRGIKALQMMLIPLKHLGKEFGEKFAEIKTAVTGLKNHFQKNLSKMAAFWKRTMKTFTFMLVRKAITAIISEVNNAIQSMAKFSDAMGTQFNKSISLLVADFQYLGRSIVSVFAPLINIIAPIIDAIVNKIATLLSYIGMLIAALGGSSSFTKAKKNVGNYAKSLDKASKSAKNLTMGIDELNILSEQESGGGSNPFDGWEDAWEEVEIPDWIKDLANKIKNLFKDLFEPIKKAWDMAKDYVLSGWKYMTAQLKKLLADVWRDFLRVWKSDTVVHIFYNLFMILGDIERVIGNIAKRLDEAWNEGEKGYLIFKNIAEIVDILVQHIRNVTEYMVGWSDGLDFNALLQSIVNLTESLKDLADFIGGVFEDVMKNVVLKYIEFMIEEGFPHLINTISEVIDAFDFEKIRQDLVPLEEAFERLLENLDIGKTNAIGNLGKMVAEFTNSQEFTDFLQRIADIMDLISAEDVEKVLTGIGKGVLDIAEGVIKFVNSDAFMAFLEALDKWLSAHSSDDIAGIFKGIALAIGLFKFGAFAGEGFVGFVRFLTLIATVKDISTIVKGMEGASSAIAAVGQALKIFSGIGLIITGAITAITAFFDMWFNGWSGVMEILKDVGIALAVVGAIILGVAAWPAVIVGAIVAAVSTIAILLHDHWEEVCAFFTETIPAWWNDTALPWLQSLPEMIGEFFAGLWETITQWASDKISAIGEWFGELKTTISEKVSEVINNIVQWFSELPGKIGYALGYVLGTFVSWGISLVTWCVENIPLIIENIVQWFVELPGKIAEWLRGVIDKFIEWGAEVISWIAENVSQFIENIVQWFVELPGKIKEKLSEIIEKFIEWKDSCIEWITTNIPLIIEEFINFFKEIPQKLYDLGTSIIQGLLDGIANAWEALKSGVSDFCNNFLQGFKDALGIASPSKEAKDIGDYVIEGLFEPFTEDQTSQLLAFTESFLNVFRTQLSADKFTAIGQDIVKGLLQPLTSSSSQFTTAVNQIFQLVTSAIQTNMQTLGVNMISLMQTFVATYILPYFGIEQWQPLFDVLMTTVLQPAFETFNTWFTETMTAWWEESLVFWFTKEKWDEEIFTPLAENIHEHWDTFSEWWDSTITDWWESQVKPWFRKELWVEQFNHILEAAKEVFDLIKEAIKERIEEAAEAVSNACEEMKSALEEVLTLIDEVLEKASGLDEIGSGVSLNVSGKFAAGGYPSQGSLFLANEAGPELIGTIGGRTAVASNDEITGIRDAVLESGNTESELLAQLINIGRAMLDKEPVVIGDREIAMMANNGQSQLGMNLIR